MVKRHYHIAVTERGGAYVRYSMFKREVGFQYTDNGVKYQVAHVNDLMGKESSYECRAFLGTFGRSVFNFDSFKFKEKVGA